eukprot:4603014-Amphidinium_carterae.2
MQAKRSGLLGSLNFPMLLKKLHLQLLLSTALRQAYLLQILIQHLQRPRTHRCCTPSNFGLYRATRCAQIEFPSQASPVA